MTSIPSEPFASATYLNPETIFEPRDDKASSLLELLSITTEPEPVPISEPEETQMAQPPMNPPKAKEFGLAKPNPFDGNWTKINRFVDQCQLYMDINDDGYGQDKKRIGFILSLMNKGEAAEWVEQYVKSIKNPTGGQFQYPTLTTFTTRLLDDFKQEDQVGDAVAKLKYLKQGQEQSVEQLVSEFRLLVGQAGLGSTSTSEQIHLIELFKDALNPRIAAKILFSDNVPTTIDGWHKWAIQYDVNRRKATAFLKKKPMKEAFTGNTRRKWNFDWLACDPNAMDVDAMTIEERSSLMKKGACFYLKEPGHISKDWRNP